jgi:hypothetical protein
MFGKSFRPEMQTRADAPSYGATERFRLRIGVLRTPAGAGLGASLAF